MDSESLYWAQYDEDFDYAAQGSAAVNNHSDDYTQGVLAQNARQPSAAYLQYRQMAEPAAASEYPSSRDSYWSRYFGHGPGSDQGTPLDDAGSARASTSDMRRLLVMPEKLASLRLNSASSNNTKAVSISAAAASASASAADAKERGTRSDQAETKASGCGQSSGQQPGHAQQVNNISSGKMPANVGNARIAQPIQTLAAAEQPRTAAPFTNSDLHWQPSSSGVQPGPCVTTTTSYGGVNPIALITRLNFLKDQIEQNERLLLV
ncbi:hypothetical protein H4R99_007743 [Coemansia sp. RSA 1722]|nr:hypothetical protein LPJ57_006778 [Coemansia sp. RSA 486]KAJ2232268.1 hypothetical protein IWW45_005091 [Coemansia sp. RSA 485]KAJ2588600.1 hypothetical protein H4R99_007743 [Coemansia sp. RSA 1722]